MSSLLILGSSGFVGTSLQNELTESEYPNFTCVASRKPPISRPNNPMNSSRFLAWDIRSKSVLQPIFDVIIHAATPASALLNSNDPGEMFNIIVQGMENVIEFASRHAVPPKLLFTSSGAVYGDIPSTTNLVPEDFPPSINLGGDQSAYAEGKRRAESMLRDATVAGHCEGIIARLFAFSGKNLPRDRHFAIGNFVDSAIATRKIVVRSDGSSIRSYLDEKDMAQWLLSIAEKGTPGNIYHVGSERSISIRDLAFLVSERCEILTGESIPVEILGQTSRLDGVSRYVPSTLQTRMNLELSEKISLENSIDGMLRAAITAQS